MKENWNLCICGEKVMLVPYREGHVIKYHRWMTDQELQRLTGSEPLNLEEEYQMQKAWRDSTDKCTFIILDKAAEIYEEAGQDQNTVEIASMIGDTNLYMQEPDGHDGLVTAEAEIMIAEMAARGKRLGWEAMSIMLRYEDCDLHRQISKMDNVLQYLQMKCLAKILKYIV